MRPIVKLVFPISYVTTFCVGGADTKETLMKRVVIKLTRQVKRRFHRNISKIKDARLKTRYLIILHTAEGYSHRNIARMLLCSPSTVDRVENDSTKKENWV